jgi:hypothetical protein
VQEARAGKTVFGNVLRLKKKGGNAQGGKKREEEEKGKEKGEGKRKNWIAPFLFALSPLFCG